MDFSPRKLPDLNPEDFDFANPLTNMQKNITRLFAMCSALADTLTDDQFADYTASYKQYLSKYHLSVAPKPDDEE